MFRSIPAGTPREFIERAHSALAGSRGAAVAVAQVASDRTIRYAGCGNIAGALVDAVHSRGLVSQNGTLGVAIRTVQEQTYPWASGFLVMHSDGLTSRWNVEQYPGVFGRHPAIIAGLIYRDALRGRDDATVVVVDGSGRD